MIYALLRYILLPLALVGWVLYQSLVKKKRWSELKHDISVIIFILCVWLLLYFTLLS